MSQYVDVELVVWMHLGKYRWFWLAYVAAKLRKWFGKKGEYAVTRKAPFTVLRRVGDMVEQFPREQEAPHEQR